MTNICGCSMRFYRCLHVNWTDTGTYRTCVRTTTELCRIILPLLWLISKTWFFKFRDVKTIVKREHLTTYAIHSKCSEVKTELSPSDCKESHNHLCWKMPLSTMFCAALFPVVKLNVINYIDNSIILVSGVTWRSGRRYCQFTWAVPFVDKLFALETPSPWNKNLEKN